MIAVALLLATIIVAFLAGMVALAMPCCFTVLLPSYMAKSFDTPSGRLGMTAVFGAGIATILLPIAIGASEVATLLSSNHAFLFVVGGFFMIILGLLTLWGVGILPMRTWTGVDLRRKDVPSVYALGIFSGVASSCCAPVLVGVLVLTVLSGSLLAALLVGLAYVSGMVFPLLTLSVLWDRGAARGPGFLRGRMLSFRLLGRDVDIHSSKLVAGTLFILMGIVTVALGVVDRMLLVPGSALFGIYQTTLEQGLLSAFGDVRIDVGLAAFLLATAATFIVWQTRRRGVRRRAPGAEGSVDAPGQRDRSEPVATCEPSDFERNHRSEGPLARG